MQKLPHWLTGLLLFSGGAALTFAFTINLCDWIYACGCHSLWNGAAEACNIHDPNSRHCPWCTTGRLGTWLPPGLTLLVQAVVAWWPAAELPLWARALGVIAAFLVVEGAVGLGFGLATGYWS